MQERIVYTKNLYYILFKCYIKYKSEKRLYCARGGRDVMKFYSRWPARILFSASHSLCVYHSSPFYDHREKERKEKRERMSERKRAWFRNRYMKHRGTPRRESRYVFSESACTLLEHTLISSRASVCTRYLSSVAVYRLILLFHSSKFKHFTLPPYDIVVCFLVSPRDDAEPDRRGSLFIGELWANLS